MTRESTYALEANDPYCGWPPEVEARLAEAPWRRLVVLGDSTATGEMGPLEGYRPLDAVSRIVEALRVAQPDLAYLNLGERDLRTAEIRDRQLAPALAFRPDLAIVGAGGNDAMRRSFDEDRFAAELTSIIRPLTEAGARVVTIGLYDWPRSGLVDESRAEAMARRMDRLDVRTAEVVTALGGTHADNHRHPVAADPGIYCQDRLHCNARGHAISAAAIARALAARPRARDLAAR